MKLQTTRFGCLEVPEANIIYFPDGLIGFETYKRYVILSKKENAPLRWLQCVDEPELAFIIISPFLFKADYKPLVEKVDLSSLKIKDISEAEILSIVVVPDNPRDMVANLMAPVLINPKICIAKQVITKDNQYPARYRILDSFNQNRESAQVLSC